MSVCPTHTSNITKNASNPHPGIVFEGFDRAGQLRAICGGGRYDKLLGAFGGEDQPCAGFGFGDAVIVELLRDKGLLPALGHDVDDVVMAMDESLRPVACGVAARLRKQGRVVDLVLEPKRMKWAFKVGGSMGFDDLLCPLHHTCITHHNSMRNDAMRRDWCWLVRMSMHGAWCVSRTWWNAQKQMYCWTCWSNDQPTSDDYQPYCHLVWKLLNLVFREYKTTIRSTRTQYTTIHLCTSSLHCLQHASAMPTQPGLRAQIPAQTLQPYDAFACGELA